ncbi:MAG: IS630 family transposase [Candidatus Methylomirabilis sp.]
MRPRRTRVVVPAPHRTLLAQWARTRAGRQDLACRAEIVLAAAKGMNDAGIARRLRITRPTVAKWVRRFRARGPEGLHDEVRSGRPRTVRDQQVAEIIHRTLHTTPADATHWSTRTMAHPGRISRETVRRVWRAFGLQPHRTATFKLSTDPLFVEKVRDICGLYLNPPDKALVLCVDEKSQIQALERTQPLLPLRLGHPAGRTHDYRRHGITSLFAALDIATGTVVGECYARHRHQEFLRFLQLLDRQVPPALAVHVVLDNYGTHKHPRVRGWLARHPRYHLHFTPTGASWLNQVERWFASLTQRQIRRGSFTSVRDLVLKIKRYLDLYNHHPRSFVWTKSADEIFTTLYAMCKDISVSAQ